jgi:dihydroorotate dehydrogenase
LSGTPLLPKAISVVRYLREKSQGRFAIIGVGGVEDADSSKQHFDAGADLVQIYSGLIFSGPGVVKKILKNLLPRD